MLQQTINQQLSTQIDGINIPNATFHISLQDVKDIATGKTRIDFNQVRTGTAPLPRPVSTENQPTSDTGTNASNRTFHS